MLAAAATAAPDPQHVQNVGCDTSIETWWHPDTSGMRLVLGRVWLPRESTVLRIPPSVPTGWDPFLKWGLFVRAGVPVVLEVPVWARRIYSLNYAANAVSTVAGGQWRDTVRACTPPSPTWTVWAGGYMVKDQVCAPLTVRAAGRTAHVRLSLGKRC